MWSSAFEGLRRSRREVSGAHQKVVLAAVAPDSAAQRERDAGRCAAQLRSRRAFTGADLLGTCFLGVNHGELGGWVELYHLDGSGGQRLADTNLLRFLPSRDDGVLLVSGTAHLSVATSRSAPWAKTSCCSLVVTSLGAK